jgi:hypothetical protein
MIKAGNKEPRDIRKNIPYLSKEFTHLATDICNSWDILLSFMDKQDKEMVLSYKDKIFNYLNGAIHIATVNDAKAYRELSALMDDYLYLINNYHEDDFMLKEYKVAKPVLYFSPYAVVSAVNIKPYSLGNKLIIDDGDLRFKKNKELKKKYSAVEFCSFFKKPTAPN